MKPKYTIGTWIRFYNNGQLVIDVITYVEQTFIKTYEYLTLHNGSVSEDSILESRSAK